MDINLTGQILVMPINLAGQVASANITSGLPTVYLNATLNQPSQSWLKDWLSLCVFAAAAFLTLCTWIWTEWAKRSYAKYLRKEQNYIKLIEGLKGYDKPENDELKRGFVHQINLCWLNCPDDVIRKANELLRTLNNEGNAGNERVKALGEFMLTIRKDALKRMPWDGLKDHVWHQTNLDQDDYRDKRTAMLKHYVLKVESVNSHTSQSQTCITIDPQSQEERKK